MPEITQKERLVNLVKIIISCGKCGSAVCCCALRCNEAQIMHHGAGWKKDQAVK